MESEGKGVVRSAIPLHAVQDVGDAWRRLLVHIVGYRDGQDLQSSGKVCAEEITPKESHL